MLSPMQRSLLSISSAVHATEERSLAVMLLLLLTGLLVPYGAALASVGGASLLSGRRSKGGDGRRQLDTLKRCVGAAGTAHVRAAHRASPTFCWRACEHALEADSAAHSVSAGGGAHAGRGSAAHDAHARRCVARIVCV
jgi:hypothetical protein